MAPQHKDPKAGPGSGPAKSKSKAKGASGNTLASNNNASNKVHHPPAHHALKKEPAPHHRAVPTENVNIDPNMTPVPGPTASVQHHPHHQQGPPPAHVQQHPRPSSIVHQQQHHPGSPHQQTQAQHQGQYNSPHLASHGVPIQQQHQAPYPSTAPAPNGQPHPEVAYYGSHPSPYGTPGSTQYSSSENPELMAAAHMQRPPYPPIYHTPQSNPPSSVASPQSHDPHGRAMYGQPQSQLPQGMYGYPQAYPPMNQVQPSPYAQHPAQHQPHQNMSSQPLLMSHQGNQQPMHQQPPQNTPQSMSNSPKPRLEPSAMQRPLDPASMQQQRPPSTQMNPNGNTQTAPPASNGMHQGPPGAGGVNSNAAPGPIPATTPLVVRQDNNGVQWIAFEYSRDRVKMEYTIRCDVESVNVDNLSQEFKTENCVYPRACCGKDQYRGNRLIYETECNTVGWALAELNPCLRGKRGLIQRAVDSWRNSNRDPKLRSRRVRRMAKLNNRKQTTHTPGHMAGPGGPVGAAPVPAPNQMAAPLQRQPQSNMTMGGGHLHHHHNHPDGPQGGDDVSGPNSNDLRPSQVFHGYPSYPSHSGMGGSMAPPLHDGMDGLGGHPSGPSAVPAKRKASEDAETTAALYGDLPESKRRKFILVDDTQRNSRVRVRVTLDQVEMKEMPDSYRKSNSVFPRAYFPMQMQDIDDKPRDPRTFADDDAAGGSANGNSDEPAVLSRTLVPIPLMGEDADANGQVPVPKIGRSKRKRESTLNELGYRMSWSQSRVFAGRILFLQKSLDAYRNKMRSTIIQNATSVPGKESETPHVAQHFETRVGKRRWLERGKRTKREASP